MDKHTSRRGIWRAQAEAAVTASVRRLMAAAGDCQADLVLVNPPFASPDRPSLGLHVLAAQAQAAGIRVEIVYANLSFASVIGPAFYRALCHTATEHLVGERSFFAACYGMDATGGDTTPQCWPLLCDGEPPEFTDVQAVAALWSDAMGAALASLPVNCIGLSSVFEQTLPALSLIRALKQRNPAIRTLLGGANADGEMGEGLAQCFAEIDHVFTGEADASLLWFLREFAEGAPGIPRIIAGEVASDLDGLPPPDFSAFFAQFHATVHPDVCEDGIDMSQIRLPYESSRGCWWGEKHHCTFCGLNANGMQHRIKSADKVAREIMALSQTHGIDRILMVDNIMPHSYFSTLLPRLTAAERKLSLFYEQKANLSAGRMMALKAAGIDSIQPGIESLSTALLKRMRKGSNAQTNLDCLRFARSAGVSIVWNLLSDFPGDAEEDYAGMAALIPLLHHLQPPDGVGGLSIDRFSPYHMDPEGFGISNVTPLEAYKTVFPQADLARVAYHFGGDYPSALRRSPELYSLLSASVDRWDKSWSGDPAPLLSLFELDDGRRLLIDTREVAVEQCRLVDGAEADVLLHGARDLSPEVSRALDLGQLAELDGRFGAIACTSPEVFTRRAV